MASFSYCAKLIGESDEYTVTRYFSHEGDAIKWAQGDGLFEFEDQAARCEISITAKWSGPDLT
jgi:hypothetical protein